VLDKNIHSTLISGYMFYIFLKTVNRWITDIRFLSTNINYFKNVQHARMGLLADSTGNVKG